MKQKREKNREKMKNKNFQSGPFAQDNQPNRKALENGGFDAGTPRQAVRWWAWQWKLGQASKQQREKDEECATRSTPVVLLYLCVIDPVTQFWCYPVRVCCCWSVSTTQSSDGKIGRRKMGAGSTSTACHTYKLCRLLSTQTHPTIFFLIKIRGGRLEALFKLGVR